MRRYYIADLLTLLEVILAGTLIWITVIGLPAEYALWIFVGGELCDALDGPCARRWHYPNDGRYRWWRHYNTEIDQLSDILLAISCGIYIIFRIDIAIGCLLLGGIGALCLFMQLILYRYNPIKHRFVERYTIANPSTIYFGVPSYDRTRHKFCTKRIRTTQRELFILFRRWIYVLAGIGGALACLIEATSYSPTIRTTLKLIAIIVAMALIVAKWNRLSQDKTPL